MTEVREEGVITVNGEARGLPHPATVGALVEALGRDGRGMAVALNEEVVTRGRWDETVLRAGDRVEVLGAAQGG